MLEFQDKMLIIWKISIRIWRIMIVMRRRRADLHKIDRQHWIRSTEVYNLLKCKIFLNRHNRELEQLNCVLFVYKLIINEFN